VIERACKLGSRVERTTRTTSDRHRVVIVGGGFGGLFAAKALRGADADVTVIDRANHHLFQPLLYQLATGILAEGDIAKASTSLRQACEIWRELGMPYEEAQTCLLLSAVCERRGDEDGRCFEIETARRIFTQLRAEHCLTRIAEQPERASQQRIDPLSEREAQVLRLLAAGKTNRAIADELFISEKTVARHVSNIFDKLGVSNRTGATAWAFQHNLI